MTEKSNKIKVLQAMPSFYHGGEQAMIVNLYKEMDKERFQFDFIVDHSEYDGLLETVKQFGAEVYYSPTFKGYNFVQICKFWDKFFSEHPEYRIMHCHIRSYSSLFLPIAKKHGLKVIIHSHNTSNGKGMRSVMSKILQIPLKDQGDYCFACSKEAGQWLFGTDIVSKDNFYIINNSIDSEAFTFNYETRKEYRKQFGFGEEKLFIQIGRFTKQKNYFFTLDVFSKHLKSHKDDKLILVGDGELIEPIKQKIADNGINDSVIFLNKRNDVNCLLMMCDYFMMPSFWEGLSVAAIEAQASDIICLMSDKVDRNVDISKKCRFLPLEEDVWLKEMESDIPERENMRKIVIDSGFDVKENSKWLQNFYESIIK